MINHNKATSCRVCGLVWNNETNYWAFLKGEGFYCRECLEHSLTMDVEQARKFLGLPEV